MTILPPSPFLSAEPVDHRAPAEVAAAPLNPLAAPVATAIHRAAVLTDPLARMAYDGLAVAPVDLDAIDCVGEIFGHARRLARAAQTSSDGGVESRHAKCDSLIRSGPAKHPKVAEKPLDPGHDASQVGVAPDPSDHLLFDEPLPLFLTVDNPDIDRDLEILFRDHFGIRVGDHWRMM
jgi:hypothetical protein